MQHFRPADVARSPTALHPWEWARFNDVHFNDPIASGRSQTIQSRIHELIKKEKKMNDNNIRRHKAWIISSCETYLDSCTARCYQAKRTLIIYFFSQSPYNNNRTDGVPIEVSVNDEWQQIVGARCLTNINKSSETPSSTYSFCCCLLFWFLLSSRPGRYRLIQRNHLFFLRYQFL